MNKIQAVLKSFRLPFLILTPACVFLGFSTALATQAEINYYNIGLVLLAAISVHVSVNTFNEYFDFRSGLDLKTTRTPFSGGSGGLVAYPDAIKLVLYVAVSALILTVLIGLYFISLHGLLLLPLGAMGVLIVLTYTPWINKHPWLCLVAPGLGFGPLMVVGTYFALTGEYALLPAFVSLVPFFLVNNLLLLNQFPDIEADKSVGRNHFPIAYGLRKSTMVYSAFSAAALLTITMGISLGFLPKTSLFTFIPLAVALMIVPAILKNAGNRQKLIPFLGINVAVTISTPVILGITLLVD